MPNFPDRSPHHPSRPLVAQADLPAEVSQGPIERQSRATECPWNPPRCRRPCPLLCRRPRPRIRHPLSPAGVLPFSSSGKIDQPGAGSTHPRQPNCPPWKTRANRGGHLPGTWSNPFRVAHEREQRGRKIRSRPTDRQGEFSTIVENSISSVETRSGDGFGGHLDGARAWASGGWRPAGRSLHISVEESRRSAESIPLQLFSSDESVDSARGHPEPLGGLVDGDPISNWCRQSHVLHTPSIANGWSVGNTLRPIGFARRP